MLLNYRVDPAILQRTLPACFTPSLVQGQAVAGICLIRLQAIRPTGMPACIGIASENAAHRMAVDWTDTKGQKQSGVYIPRRDTSSRLTALMGH